MNKLWMATICALLAPAAAAAADNSIASGQWKVTTKTTMNGGTLPPQVKARCLTAEQAGDVGKTFGPTVGTVNSNCERSEFEASGQTLKWRLKCTGQMDMDVAAVFNFDSPEHYTAIILTRGYMAGALTNDVKTELEGEHLGACE
jgi:Protein of unknown function (DUF3617)